MKFKRTLAVMLSLAAIGTSAHAAGVRVTVSGTQVTLSADTDAAKKASIIVARKGADIDDDANIYEMYMKKADENGKLTHTFVLPEYRGGISSYGEYEVFVKPDGGEMLTGEFSYVTAGDIADLLEALRAENADFAAIFAPESTYRTSLKAIGCIMDEYDAAENAEIVTFFANAFSRDLTEEKIAKTFNTAVLAKTITDADSAKRMLGVYSPDFENVSYADMQTAKKDWIAKTVASYMPFASTADFEEKYAVANVFYNINNARFDKLESVLAGYAENIGIKNSDEYKDYLALTVSKRGKANESIAKSLNKNPVSEKSSLLNVIDTAVKAAKKSSTGGSGGSGGGSTGSSGGIISSGPQTITQATTSGNDKFTDLAQTAWAENAILALREKGIVNGKGDGIFAPKDAVTREEFTTMIVNASGVYTPGENVYFDDVTPDDWCYSYVASAFNNKLIYGVSETTFGKGMNISRQDMAVIAYRAAKDSGKIHAGREMTVFADDANIADYAREAVEALYKSGVINGSDGYFNPTSQATRAEAAVIIYNLFVK